MNYTSQTHQRSFVFHIRQSPPAGLEESLVILGCQSSLVLVLRMIVIETITYIYNCVCVNESLSVSPGSDPGFGVHFQSAAPHAVFLRRLGQESSLDGELLGHGADVIRLEPAAAANITDAGLIGLPGVLLHLPAGQDPRLQS